MKMLDCFCNYIEKYINEWLSNEPLLFLLDNFLILYYTFDEIWMKWSSICSIYLNDTSPYTVQSIILFIFRELIKESGHNLGQIKSRAHSFIVIIRSISLRFASPWFVRLGRWSACVNCLAFLFMVCLSICLDFSDTIFKNDSEAQIS